MIVALTRTTHADLLLVMVGMPVSAPARRGTCNSYTVSFAALGLCSRLLTQME